MSLKGKKCVLLVLAILMMLMVIPTTFAEDVDAVADETISCNVNETFSSGSEGIVAASDDTDVSGDFLETCEFQPILSDAETGVYYVGSDGVGSDSNNGKTEDTPFSTISKAIGMSDAKEIRLLEGTHTLTSYISVSKNIIITGIGEVNITRSGAYIFHQTTTRTVTLSNLNFIGITYNNNPAIYYMSTGTRNSKLTITDCNFINNSGYYLIRTYDTTVNIVRCNFINNIVAGTSSFNGGLINIYHGGSSYPVNVSYSNFAGNSMTYNYYITAYSANGQKIYADNNYWDNKEPTNVCNDNSKVTRTNYITFTGSTPSSGNYADSDIELIVKFQDNSGNNITFNMATLPLILTADNGGTITPSSVSVSKLNTTTYTNENVGSETVHVKYGSTELTSFTFTVEDNPEGTLFVDAAEGNDENGDGSSSTPFATISHALDNLGNNYRIIVKAGEYTLDGYTINSDVVISGKNGAKIKTAQDNILKIASGVSVNISKIIFTGATGYAIDSEGNLNIIQSLFIDNAGIIKSTGSLNITYSAFINNTNTIDASSFSGEYNFWGTNNAPEGVVNYVILTPTFSDEFYTDNVYTLTLTFTDNNGDTLSKSIPDVNATVATTFGSITPQTVIISDNVGVATYVSSATGNGTVTVKIKDNVIKNYDITVEADDSSKIYVDAKRGDDDNGLGSKAKPYKTIQKAYNSAGSGATISVADGTYEFASQLSVGAYNKDNIKFEASGDNVILKATGSNAIFSPSGYYNVEIIGFIFVNGGGSRAFISGSGGSSVLKITNCTFANSTSTYGPIYSANPTQISGCVFINNTATGHAIYTSSIGFVNVASQLTMDYCIFVGNTLTNSDHKLVYASSGTIDNNYWGSNDGLDSSLYQGVSYSNWIVINPVMDDSYQMHVGLSENIDFKFSDNDGNDLSGDLINKHIILSTIYGSVNPDSTSIKDNEITTRYTAVSQSAENIPENVVAYIYGFKLANITFEVLPKADGLYVSSSGSDDTGDGSLENPYATIKKAYESLGDETVINVLTGNYNIDSLEIKQNTSIAGLGTVNINVSGNGIIISSATLNLTNLRVTGSASNIISSFESNLNIESCLFENIKESIISVADAGVLNINNSVFINNSGVIISGSNLEGNINNNFWGSNNKPSFDSGLTMDNYIILNATISGIVNGSLIAETIHEVNIMATLNDGSTYQYILPKFTVDLTSNAGTIDSSVTVDKNHATANYYSPVWDVEDEIDISAGNVIKTIIFTLFENEEGRIYVNGSVLESGNGSKKSPFKTIKEAIAKNKELGGGYQIIVNEGLYTEMEISSTDMKASFNMTGRGNIVIDLNNSYLFSLSFTSSDGFFDYEFNNLNFINQGSGSLMYYSYSYASSRGNIAINNCTFINGSGNYIIYTNYANVKMTNSLIVNYALTSYALYLRYYNFVNVNYNALLNVSASSGLVYTYASSGTADFNYNFWGSNTNHPSAAENWVVANMTIDSDKITAGDTPTITVTLKLNNGPDLAQSLPKFNLTITSQNGNTFSPAAVTVIDNVGKTIFNALEFGDDVVNLTSGNNLLDNLTFYVRPADDGNTIFVDASYNGGDGDGSIDKPYTTLKDALDKNAALGGSRTISIAEGNYTISDYIINDNVYIMWAKRTVIIKATDLTVNAGNVTFNHLIFKDGDTITVRNAKNLTVLNTTFLNNNGVISSKGNLIILESKFINNTATDGGIISVTGGSIKIAYSEFVANNVGRDKIVYSTVSGDINNNYWGSNDEPDVSDIIKPGNWIVLIVEKPDTVNASEIQTFTFVFKNTTDGTTWIDLTKSMPDIEIGLVPAIGSVKPVNITIKENTALTTYNATAEGEETINFTVMDIKFDDIEFAVGKSVAGKIFVATWGSDTTGDGSRLNPYATLNEALSHTSADLNEIVIFEGIYI